MRWSVCIRNISLRLCFYNKKEGKIILDTRAKWLKSVTRSKRLGWGLFVALSRHSSLLFFANFCRLYIIMANSYKFRCKSCELHNTNAQKYLLFLMLSTLIKQKRTEEKKIWVTKMECHLKQFCANTHNKEWTKKYSRNNKNDFRPIYYLSS